MFNEQRKDCFYCDRCVVVIPAFLARNFGFRCRRINYQIPAPIRSKKAAQTQGVMMTLKKRYQKHSHQVLLTLSALIEA